MNSTANAPEEAPEENETLSSTPAAWARAGVSRRLFLVATLCLGCIVTACRSSPLQETQRIEFGHDAEIEVDGQRRTLRKGEAMAVPMSPMLISAPGKRDILVLPAQWAEDASFQVNLSASGRAGEGGSAQPGLGSAEPRETIHVILSELSAIQDDLAQGRAQAALERTLVLERTFPGVTFLNFTKASCLFVLGRRGESRSVLEKALKEFPENALGLALLRRLEKEPP